MWVLLSTSWNAQVSTAMHPVAHIESTYTWTKRLDEIDRELSVFSTTGSLVVIEVFSQNSTPPFHRHITPPKHSSLSSSILITSQFAQELLSTFGTSLGEVALQPSTGGIFTVRLYHSSEAQDLGSSADLQVKEYLLWDRKTEGGFPGMFWMWMWSTAANKRCG